MIDTISINESDQWDRIVRSFNNYDVNYLSSYAKAFQMNGDGEPLLIYYNDDNTRAINVIMKRDIALSSFFKNKLPVNTWFDITTPYGYGGFWIEGEKKELVENAYEEFCRKEGFISEFVRFHLYRDYPSFFNGTIESITHNVVRELSSPIDEILVQCERKVRANFKKAKNSGLKIELDTSGNRLDEFINIYYGTMLRNNAKPSYFFSEDFFKKLNELKGNYLYAYVLLENKVISTELVLYGTENCYTFLGGTDSDYYNFRPNDFLKIEIMKWAQEKGLKRYILGGGYGKDDGIYSYKKSFAPEGICNFYIGKRIFNEEKYNELVKMRMEEEFNSDTHYFPKYRA